MSLVGYGHFKLLLAHHRHLTIFLSGCGKSFFRARIITSKTRQNMLLMISLNLRIYEGRENHYMKHHGKEDSLTVASSPAVQIQDGFAASVWIKPDASAGTILHKQGEYDVSLSEDGRVVFSVQT